MSGSVTVASNFIEAPFPLEIGYNSSGTIQFNTTVTQLAGGREQRNANWSQALHSTEVSSGIQGPDEFALLLSHFHVCYGRAFAFRMRDWGDYTSAADHTSPPSATDMFLVMGDGGNTVFQLTKTYRVAGSALVHVREIQKPVPGTVSIAVNGNTVPSTAWTCDTTTGIVTFVQPPLFGDQVTAGFEYDVPSRYDTDSLPETYESWDQRSTQVGIREVRL